VFRGLSQRGRRNFAERKKLTAEAERAICREWTVKRFSDGEEERCVPDRER
jgi:hypothetical protein